MTGRIVSITEGCFGDILSISYNGGVIESRGYLDPSLVLCENDIIFFDIKVNSIDNRKYATKIKAMVQKNY